MSEDESGVYLHISIPLWLVLMACMLWLFWFVWTRWYVLDTPACWFPKPVVPFHNGMTLCPGQRAEAYMIVRLKPAQKTYNP